MEHRIGLRGVEIELARGEGCQHPPPKSREREGFVNERALLAEALKFREPLGMIAQAAPNLFHGGIEIVERDGLGAPGRTPLFGKRPKPRRLEKPAKL